MRQRAGLFVVAYDVSSDRERAKVAKVIEGYGLRVQGSVFECRLSAGLHARLRQALDHLKLATGFVLLYRIHENSRRVTVGEEPERPLTDDQHAWVIAE